MGASSKIEWTDATWSPVPGGAVMTPEQKRIAELERALAVATCEWRGWLDAADSWGWQYDQADRARLRECSRVLKGEE